FEGVEARADERGGRAAAHARQSGDPGFGTALNSGGVRAGRLEGRAADAIGLADEGPQQMQRADLRVAELDGLLRGGGDGLLRPGGELELHDAPSSCATGAVRPAGCEAAYDRINDTEVESI